jgi:hypothetical protein
MGKSGDAGDIWQQGKSQANGRLVETAWHIRNGNPQTERIFSFFYQHGPAGNRQ